MVPSTISPSTKNFELFNKLNNSKETVERARQDANDMATKLHKKKIRLNKRINNKQTLFIYCMIIVAFGYVVFMD